MSTGAWEQLTFPIAATEFPVGTHPVSHRSQHSEDSNTSDKASSSARSPAPPRRFPGWSVASSLEATGTGISGSSPSVHSTDAGQRGVPASQRASCSARPSHYEVWIAFQEPHIPSTTATVLKTFLTSVGRC